jgi:hypothetical protein
LLRTHQSCSTDAKMRAPTRKINNTVTFFGLRARVVRRWSSVPPDIDDGPTSTGKSMPTRPAPHHPGAATRAARLGPAAGGTARAPNLLPRVRDMGPRQFASIVLNRYDWSAVATQTRGDGAALDALIDKIVRRQDYPLSMPAIHGEPSVNAHLIDLYAYLSARATGAQGPERPKP